MTVKDDFNPAVYTVEQQREGFEDCLRTEMIRSALKSPLPSLLGALLDLSTGGPLFPNLAYRNEELMANRVAPDGDCA
jgi:hypothetical protein